jgi:RNA polymerase sigma factor (sigma-70 family)
MSSADLRAQREFYKKCEGRVLRAVLKIPASHRRTCSVEELVQAGMAGVARALKGFDPARTRADQTAEEAFWTYAARAVKGDVVRRLLEERKAPARLIASHRKSQPPTPEQRWTTYGEDLGAAVTSLLVGQYHDDWACKSPEELLIKREEREAVYKALGELPKRIQRVFEAHYGSGKSFVDIAGELGIDDSGVSKIHKAGLALLRVDLGDPYVSAPSSAKPPEVPSGHAARRRESTVMNLPQPRLPTADQTRKNSD